MSARPQHVKCVCLGVGPKAPDYGKSWCGRDVYFEESVSLAAALATPERGGALETDYGKLQGKGADTVTVRRRHFQEFAFVDATHALLSGRSGDALQFCPECSAAMYAALLTGTYKPRKS